MCSAARMFIHLLHWMWLLRAQFSPKKPLQLKCLQPCQFLWDSVISQLGASEPRRELSAQERLLLLLYSLYIEVSEDLRAMTRFTLLEASNTCLI